MAEADDRPKAEDKLLEITECPICMSAFTDSRMLLCIHTFCFECLKHTTDATQKKPGDKMPCPLCRKEFIIPEDGMHGVQKTSLWKTSVSSSLRCKWGAPPSSAICVTSGMRG